MGEYLLVDKKSSNKFLDLNPFLATNSKIGKRKFVIPYFFVRIKYWLYTIRGILINDWQKKCSSKNKFGNNFSWQKILVSVKLVTYC